MPSKQIENQKLIGQKLKKPNAKGGDRYNTMITVNRSKIIAEEVIREHIRSRISINLKSKLIAENNIRKVIRKLLEVETGTEEPSTFTGINVLADLLEKIVPVLEDDYKMLTTSLEQRESFRNHIIHAVKNSLNPIESSTSAENIPENFKFTVDREFLLEKVKIDLDPDEEESIEGEFIDISDSENESDDFVEIEDQNETGRNFAAASYKKIEKQIVDAYDMLADGEDQKLYYDYLLTNLLLYFDKFEDELQPSLPETTTPEYEEAAGEPDATEPSEEESEDSGEDLFS